MKTLKTLFTGLFFVVLVANVNADPWTQGTGFVTLTTPTDNVRIGNSSTPVGKLNLYNVGSVVGVIYGLHSTVENTHSVIAPAYGIYSTNTNKSAARPLYGAYFKNVASLPNPNPSGTIYGVYTDNSNSGADGITYGFYSNNVSNNIGSSKSYGIYCDNTIQNIGSLYGGYFKNAGTNNGGAVYGIQIDNDVSTSYSVYGIHLSNNQNTAYPNGVMYGIYSTSTKSGANGSVYGIYSAVSGATDDKRWSGYFKDGNVAVINGNVSIGTETANNDQSWQRVLDVYAANTSKLLVRNSAVKTGIFSHNLWNGTVGRIGTESNHDLRLMANYGNDVMILKTNGNVGIGREPYIDYKLDVAGIIRAKEVVVNTGSGADFVFDESYTLKSLDEVHNFIQTNKHLPEIPSAADMINNGLDIGEFQIKLLQKIEELTLYVIDQERRINQQQEEIYRLKNR